MSRSSFSKAYEEITNLNPMEMTFTIEDADLDKLHDVLKDINVRECLWFEVQDKHGNKARYYRNQWIPCTPETMPEDGQNVLVSYKTSEIIHVCQYHNDGSANPWYSYIDQCRAYMNVVIAWMPLPEPYGGEQE